MYLLILSCFEKIVDRLGQIVEGVHIRRWWRGVALTESRKIRRYQMIACCEQGDERIELARGRGEPVQEHDRRRVLRTSFAIENSNAINRHAMIGRCRGRRLKQGGTRRMFNGQRHRAFRDVRVIIVRSVLPGRSIIPPDVSLFCRHRTDRPRQICRFRFRPAAAGWLAAAAVSSVTAATRPACQRPGAGVKHRRHGFHRLGSAA